MTTAIERLATIYPPCRICGKPWLADTETEAEHLLEVDAENRNYPANYRVTMLSLWVCDKCRFMTQEAQAASERKWKHGQLVEDTYGYGKMPRAAITHNFTQSTSQAEARNQDAWKTAHEWRNECSFWIQGNKGTGKTFMGRCLLNWAIDQVISVYEVNAVDFCEWVYRQGEKERHEAERIDILMLDDVDKPEWRVDSLIALWRLMDIRSRDKLHTIITANVSPEVMLGRWRLVEGKERSIASPMVDRMQNFKRIELTGASLRREG